jgi:multiple sugar transport system permease protein
MTAVLISGCGKEDSRIKLVVWGLQASEESKGLDAAVAEFERRHPNIDVRVLSMGAGNMDPQKLMTSIVGNVPPDVIHQDRFTIGDWASRDTFMPLDKLIERDSAREDTGAPRINPEEFYKACWAEATYKGKVYAIPFNTDDRALYYNRKLFRMAGLDPDRPPRTWEELKAYAVRLTAYRKDGGFKRIGFIPNFGNSWLYLYSWQNNGEFMSTDGRTCTMNNPRSVGALRYMVSIYDSLKGVEAVDSFATGFKANELDPFLTDLVAMKIDGNWFLDGIARYGPDLDFGVAPAPVPTARYQGKAPFAGQPEFITWSGGFSLAIPRGAKHVEESWEFIKWMVSEDAARISCQAQRKYNLSKGRPYVPNMTANSRINEVVFREFAPKSRKFREPLRLFIDLMDVSRFRPVTFVGQRLWDEHARAFEQATRHKLTPQQAMDAGTQVVQKELDKVFNRGRYKVLNWGYPLALVCLVTAAGIILVVRKLRHYRPMGRVARSEAAAGILFASPWILGFVVFTIGPIIASVIFSLCDYDVLHAARWVGLQNYRELLTDDWPKYTSKALYNVGFLAAIGLPLGIITSLSIALLLNTKIGGMTWYRTVYYLPSIVPIVANSILWIWVLNPEFGLINAAWRATLSQWFGVAAPAWLTTEQWSKPALILMGLWGAGGGMILWLAGLQGVPQHLYEAADIDGANWWSRFWNVTVPMLTPYIFFNLIIGTIGVLQTFEIVYIMTKGGPVDSTMVPVLYLFQNAFQYFKMGYASAIAWILFVIILALSLVQIKLAPRWVHYEAEKGK